MKKDEQENQVASQSFSERQKIDASSLNGHRVVSLHSLKNQRVIADKCVVAETFWERLKGLMGHDGLAKGEAMLFPHCTSVHVWFMRFSIDVVFLKSLRDSKQTLEVVSITPSVKPWKILPVNCWKANHCLELSAGSSALIELQVGDRICLSSPL